MGIAMGIVSRNRYQTTAQKLVQARVYAQGLTVLVLLACAALEIGDRHRETGRWETIKVIDPTDPEHKRKIEKKVYNEHAGGDTSWQSTAVLLVVFIISDSSQTWWLLKRKGWQIAMSLLIRR